MKDNENIKLTEQERNNLNNLIGEAADLEKRTASTISDEKIERAYQTVKRETGLDAKQQSNAKIPKWYYAAAAVFVLFAIGIGYLFTPYTIKTAPGTIRTVALPDQTTVTLSGNSVLSYPRLFGWDDRTVTLHGKAFFNVTTTGQPFKVMTNNAQIMVMGTQFSVQTNKGSLNKTVVYLKEGKVSLAPKDKKEEGIILEPGQLTWISEKHPLPASPKIANQSEMLNWLHKELSFTNQPLSEIFTVLETRYGVEFKTKSKQILQEKLTIYFSNPKSAEQAVGDICSAKGYQYIRREDTFIISK